MLVGVDDGDTNRVVLFCYFCCCDEWRWIAIGKSKWSKTPTTTGKLFKKAATMRGVIGFMIRRPERGKLSYRVTL